MQYLEQNMCQQWHALHCQKVVIHLYILGYAKNKR